MEEVLAFLNILVIIGAVLINVFATNEAMTALGCAVVAQVAVNAITERRR